MLTCLRVLPTDPTESKPQQFKPFLRSDRASNEIRCGQGKEQSEKREGLPVLQKPYQITHGAKHTLGVSEVQYWNERVGFEENRKKEGFIHCLLRPGCSTEVKTEREEEEGLRLIEETEIVAMDHFLSTVAI